MAKRYKKKEEKINKKRFLFVLCFTIVIILAIFFVFSNKMARKKEEIYERKIKLEKEIILQSDLLKLEEVKEELKNKIGEQMEGIPLTKAIYQLKSLDEGEISLEYYKEEEFATLIRIMIDINTKKIMDIEVKKDKKENIAGRKLEIIDNCTENVEADFKIKEKEMNEDSYVRIIITETEIAVSLISESDSK